MPLVANPPEELPSKDARHRAKRQRIDGGIQTIIPGTSDLDSLGTSTPTRSVTSLATASSPSVTSVYGYRASPAPHAFKNQQQFKEHMKTCINLQTMNKIDTKNAFNLHIIDYMNQLAKQDTLTFAMATSALDAGTKIYVNRVDCVHTDAQKVANAIVQALDGKSGKKGKEVDDNEEDMNADDSMEGKDEEKQPKQKKKTVVKKKKTGSKIASTEESLTLSKVETNVEIDPIFFKLTTSHDMGNVNGLFLTNLTVSANGSLIMDSNAPNELSTLARKAIEDNARNERETSSTTVVLDKPVIDALKDCCEGTGSYSRRRMEKQKNSNARKNHYKILGDRFLNEFLFAQREANLDTEYMRDTSHWDQDKSEFTFDLNADIVDEEEDVGGVHLGLSFEDDNEEDALMMDLEGHGDEDAEDRANNRASLQRSILSAVNMESLPDLKKLLSTEGGEYSYFKNLAVVGSWAGPKFWKTNVWLKMKQLREARLAALSGGDHPDVGEDGQPISSTSSNIPPITIRKNKKTDIPLQDYSMIFSNMKSNNTLPDRLFCKKTIKQKLKIATLEKWNVNAEFLVLPPYLLFDPQDLLKPFDKSSSFFRIVDERERLAKKAAESRDHKKTADFGSAPSSPNPSDCPDDEMPMSQPPEDCFLGSQETPNPFALTNAASQMTAGFHGENLVDEPNAIPYVHLQYAKYAKRIDVKKLKRAMMNSILEGEKSVEESFTAPTASSTVIESNGTKLTHVYSALPREIPPQMTKEMSPAIAFVTLLHLANEHVSSFIQFCK